MSQPTQQIDDGGPACPIFENVDGKASYTHLGMTLRDAFAMAALQGMLANSEANRRLGARDWAREAYAQADAMISTRKESK